jgi:N-acyl homoserine lactone hydrolase
MTGRPETEVEVLQLATVTALPPGHPELATFSPFPVHGWVIRHHDGPILFDTGIGEGNAYIDEHYRPRITSISTALAAVGLTAGDLVAVVISHLHFDHCGQLGALTAPTYMQEAELEASKAKGYTVAEWAAVPPERLRPVRGDVEIASGVTAILTPGHTPGHQSMLVETNGARVVLAAQCAFRAEELLTGVPASSNLHARGWADAARTSLSRLRSLAPVEIHLSHDTRVTRIN